MIRIKSILLLLAVLSVISVKGQVFTPGDFNDGIYVKENADNKKFIPYTYLREGDVQWSKRVWRNIDLKEKMNQALYYPVEPTVNRTSLFQLLMKGLFSKNSEEQIYAFDDEEFRKPIDTAKFKSIFVYEADSALVDMVDSAGNTVQVMQPGFRSDDWIYSNLLGIRLKEDWFFDKQKSVLECRIIGIGIDFPQSYDKISATLDGTVGPKTIWFYFPQCRPLFAATEVYNTKNDSERRTFDDIFWKRQFASNIVRESNVYDREIQSYSKGIDALLENERVKNDIFKYEHDMWHF